MPTTGLPRILIVDDEREITEILADLLNDDYECLKAGSAEQALDCLRNGEFELVISDITMPGMSGLEMIPHVKQLSPDTVVVMISGMQTVESAIGALRLGAFDYLMKPFDLRQVLAVGADQRGCGAVVVEVDDDLGLGRNLHVAVKFAAGSERRRIRCAFWQGFRLHWLAIKRARAHCAASRARRESCSARGCRS